MNGFFCWKTVVFNLAIASRALLFFISFPDASLRGFDFPELPLFSMSKTKCFREACWYSHCNGEHMRDPRVIAEHAIIYPLHPETPAKSIKQYADILDPEQFTKDGCYPRDGHMMKVVSEFLRLSFACKGEGSDNRSGDGEDVVEEREDVSIRIIASEKWKRNESFPDEIRSRNSLRVAARLLALIESAPSPLTLTLISEHQSRRIDFNEMNREVDEHIASLAAGFRLKESDESLMSDRNVAQLCRSLALGSKELVDETLKESLTRLEELPEDQQHSQPRSRIYQAVADIREAIRGGDEDEHFDDAVRVWDAVAAETSAAVANSHNTESDINRAPEATTSEVSSSRVELPVRVDIVGGWSDTPPWSLERSGCVLNMALQLNAQSPLSAEVTLHRNRGDGTGSGTAWVTTITDEAGASVTIQDRSSIEPPFHPDDRFRLVKAALVVTGFTAGGPGAGGGRLEVSTFSDVPRGSGLGVSSILAAAVVKALVEVKGQDASAPNVVRLVLVVEQIMGTGGGWQDQVGGVYPGIKCTTGRPFMSLQVKPVPVSAALRSALHSRMLVVFTGQVNVPGAAPWNSPILCY